MPRNDDDDDDRHMPKYSGVRGQPYTTWIQAVQEWAEAEFLKDDDFSMHDVYTQHGQGDLHGPAMPAGGAPLATAARKCKKRQLKAKKELSQAQQDKRLREMIIALPIGDAQARVGGVGVGARAWLLLEQECSQPMSALEKRLIRVKYDRATIRALVGFCPTSITDFNRQLNSILHELPAADRPSDTERSEKILECVSNEAPDALALEATKELQANANRIFVVVGAAFPNNRDLLALVSHFDQTWNNFCNSGKIKSSPASGAKGDRTTLIARDDDGTDDKALAATPDRETYDTDKTLTTDDTNDNFDPDSDFDNDDAYTLNEWNALVMRRQQVQLRRGFGSSANTPVSMEIICNRCRGFGHREAVCPSVAKDRPISTCIAVLTRVNGGATNKADQSAGDHAAATSNPRQRLQFRGPSPNRTRRPMRRPRSSAVGRMIRSCKST